MPGQAVKERLAQDVALWQADGLISPETGGLLRLRYDTPGFGVTTLIKYLGISGGMLAALGLMGLFAAMTKSVEVAGFLSACLSAFFFYGGLHLARDPQARYTQSSKSVLLLAIGALAGAVAVLANEVKVDILFSVGIVCLPITIGLAYRFRNTFLLTMGLIGFFHWVGSWNQMWGRSTYELSVQDPKVMSAVSLGVIAVGVLHERWLTDRVLRFHLAYETLGLIYLNLSLMILSIDHFDWRIEGTQKQAVYVILWAAGATAQIVAGARLKNSLFIAFGVTSLSINMFTRYYENFWDEMHKGLFFLMGGAMLFGIGALIEKFSPRYSGAES